MIIYKMKSIKDQVQKNVCCFT